MIKIPLFRPFRALWRSFVKFCDAGWPGFALGSVGATLGLAALVGAFRPTGFGRPFDVAVAVVLTCFGIALTGLVLLLLRLMLRVVASRFLFWVMGSFVFGAVAFALAGIPFERTVVILGIALVLLGGGGMGLTVSLRHDLRATYRVVGGLMAVGSVVASVVIILRLAAPGSDPFIETRPVAEGRPVVPLGLPDPSKPGTFQVRSLTYGSGSDRWRKEYGVDATLRTKSVDASPLMKKFKGIQANLRKWSWGFGKEAFPINGRVWYPDGPGPFPLILCVHGNHTALDFSDLGYSYLGERLASRGFIFVTVDENFLNSGWEGEMSRENAVRGWILLKHLEVWRGWNQEAGHRFQGRVDMDRIALIGHSRGGEAVAIAAAYNRLQHWPEDGTQSFEFGFNIRSVVAIAPVDGQYETSDVPTPVRDVDYLVLHGSHDGDVTSFHGERVFRRLAFTDDKPRFKAALHIYRANHSQFNMLWGNNDFGDAQGCLLARGALLHAEDQRRVALVAIGAFLEATLNGHREYIAFFRDPRRGNAWLPGTLLLQQYEDTTFKRLATFEEDIDPGSTTVPGGRIESERLTVWKEGHIRGRGDFDFRHKAVWLGWEQVPTNQVAATYSITLPPTFSQEAKLDGNSELVLTLADTDDDPHAGPEDKKNAPPEKNKRRPNADHGNDNPKDAVDFTVELVTEDGAIAALPLSVCRPLQPVLRVRLTKWDLFERQLNETSWEPVFQTFELPLSMFEESFRAFKSERLRTVRLRFDKSPRGVLILDQVAFASRDELAQTDTGNARELKPGRTPAPGKNLEANRPQTAP
ncbi:MAG: alpha/beta hydrolase family protein [Verrucomicrobiia bacterium]